MSDHNGGSAVSQADGFVSLEALRAVHVELLKRQREAGVDPASLPVGDSLFTGAAAYIVRGRNTGATLDTDADRAAAQSLLDYWASVLYRAGVEPPDATLAEFDPDLAPELPDEPSPYRGLEAFQELQHDWFFGRQSLIDKLAGQIREHRFVSVVGASGSGKSSLVLGGLLPALKAGELAALPDSRDWRYCTPIVPGAQPLVSLSRAAQSVAPAGLTVTDAAKFVFAAEGFLREPGYLAELMSIVANVSTDVTSTAGGDAGGSSGGSSGGSTPVCLIVDQFEEVFTLCSDDAARSAFVNNLIQLTRGDAPQRVIVTMRSDYEDNVARMPELNALFQQAQVRVTAMSAGELREAIEKPAQKVGLRFDEGVVDALLRDILGEPAGLPLLQFALLQLWRGRARNRITWQAYRKLGNAREALARTADEVYGRLIPEEQEAARRILMRMVRPGAGMEVTSSRVPRAELRRLEASDRVDRVLDRLIRSGLVRLSRGEDEDRDLCEVAHEALVRNWPRLLGWLDKEREALRQRYRLADAAQQWQQRGRDPDLLLRGQALADAEANTDLGGVEIEYVRASRKAAEAARRAAEIERETAQRRELEREKAVALAEAERRRAQQARRFTIFVSVLLVIALIASGFALVALKRALDADKVGRSRELAAVAINQIEVDPERAILLSLQAFDSALTFEARDALRRSVLASRVRIGLRGHEGPVFSAVFSPDGQTVLTASYDSTARLWDAATGQEKAVLRGHERPVVSAVFSPDGQTVLTASYDSTARLWDAATGKEKAVLRGHEGRMIAPSSRPTARPS